MTKRRSSHDPSRAAEVMPDFMRGHAGKGWEHLDPDDFLWMGDDGRVDPERLLGERGYDSRTPLDYLLLALINPHPPREKTWSVQDRLRHARSAILGEGKSGATERDDYDQLLAIGWQYLAKSHAKPEAQIKIEPIARACLRRLPDDDRRRLGGTEQSRARRLARKFNKDKDLILARITSDKTEERIQKLRQIRDILRALQKLGIAVDMKVLRPPAIPKEAT